MFTHTRTKRSILAQAAVAASLSMAAATLPCRANDVKVYRDGVLVSSRSTFKDALALVPNTLNGHYVLEAAAGTYNEGDRNGNFGIHVDKLTYNSTLGTQFTLTLRAAAGAAVWLGGAGATVMRRRLTITAASDFITIEGFNISGATEIGIFVEIPGLANDGVNNCTVRRNFITGDYSGSSGMTYGILLAGGRIDRAPDFSDNRITNVNVGIQLNSGQALNGSYGQIRRNVIENLTGRDPATAAGIAVWGNPSTSVVADGLEISDNTIRDPRGADSGVMEASDVGATHYTSPPPGAAWNDIARQGALVVPCRLREARIPL